MTQIAVAAGSNTSVALAAGSKLLLTGQGTYRIGPLGTSQRPTVDELIDTMSTIGPFSDSCTVQMWATGSGATYEVVLPTDVLDQTGRPLVSGGGIILGQQHTPVNKSDADANESAALFTLDIPANTLGVNSALRVRTLWTVPSSAATKRLRGRFGGVVLWNLDLTTHVSYPLEFVLCNRNSLTSQIAQANNLSWAVALASSAVQTFAVDFGTAQQLTITAQWPAAGVGSNNITLESAIVQHIRGV